VSGVLLFSISGVVPGFFFFFFFFFSFQIVFTKVDQKNNTNDTQQKEIHLE